MLVTDSFNRADDAAALGVADTGQTWVAQVGTWQILSNTARCGSASFLGVAGFTFGGGDVDMSVVLATQPGGNNIGLTFRWSDSNNYWRLVWDSANATNLFLQKRVAGGLSTVASYAVTHTAGKTLRVVASGSSIDVYFDGSLLGNTSDSFNSTAAFHGLHSNNTLAQLDDFTAYDGLDIVAGSQATETDTAGTGGPEVPVAGSKATEADTGNAGAPAVVKAGAKATETDAGSVGAPAVTHPGAQATETDTASHGGSHTSGVTPPAPPAPSPTGGTPEPPGASQEVDAEFSIRDIDDLSTELATITASAFDWTDPENRPGGCTLVVQDDDPNIAELVADRAVVVKLNGTEAFTVICDQLDDDVIHPNEERDQVTTVTGRMLRSITDRARVQPPRGYKQSPWGDSRTFSCFAREFSPGPEWVQATEIVPSQISPSAYYGGKPVGWFDPTAVWIAPSTGDDSQAQTGVWYAIGDFVLDEDTDLVLIFAADNAAHVFFDGFLISDVSTDVGFGNTTRYTIKATAGSHRIGARVVNYAQTAITEPPFGGGAVDPGNPTAFICACFKIDNRGALGELVIHTDFEWSLLEFPDDPPGMSIRQIARIVLDENRALAPDVLAGVAITGTDFVDEDGRPWPIYEFITVDVGRSLSELLEEWSLLYCDWDLPGPTNKTIHMWTWHGAGGPSGVQYQQSTDPQAAGLDALRRTDLPIISDALQVRWAGGWLRVPETGGTKVGLVKLSKAASIDEATRIGNQVLALYGVTRRMWAGTFKPTVVDGDVPYLDFYLRDTHRLASHLERTIELGGTLTDNGIVFRSKTKDLVQLAEDRVLAAISRMADGTLGGVAPASPAGPSPRFGVDAGGAQQTFSVPNPIVVGPATKIDVFPFSGNLFQVMFTLETPGSTDTAAEFLVDFGAGFLDVLGGNGVIPAGVKVVFVPVNFLGRSTVFITGGEGGDILSVNITAVGVDAAGMTLKPVWL